MYVFWHWHWHVCKVIYHVRASAMHKHRDYVENQAAVADKSVRSVLTTLGGAFGLDARMSPSADLQSFIFAATRGMPSLTICSVAESDGTPLFFSTFNCS